MKPTANTAYTMINLDFEYAAGESLDGAYLDPGDYDWFVNAFDINASLIGVGAHGTFTINPLEVIPDDEHYAALAGTLLPDDPEDADADLDADDCRTQILSADNQSACDSLRSTPVLRWADKPNVGSYLLYVAHDKEMTNPVYDLDQNGIFTPLTLTQPMWTPAAALPDSQAGTAYYYRVVPCSYQKCEALSHAEHSFDKLSRKVVLNQARYTPVDGTAPIVCPPASTPPNHQECQNDVTLSWQDFRTTEKSPDVANPLQTPGRTEARSYIVQTAQDPSFQTLIENIEVDQTTFTSYITTYPEGPIYWRVQAVDGSGNKLDWSDTGVFDKVSPKPVLLDPDGSQAVRGDLFFSWTSLPFAAQYRVEVYKNHDTAANAVNLAFPAATVQSRMVSLTALLPELPLMPNGDHPYVWRVRRLDAEGRTRRLERLGALQGRRGLGDADLSSRQRLGPPVRRAVHVVGRARRGELPLRTAARRHPHQHRADHHAGAVLGAAARDRRRELGVAGHPHRRVGQQPQGVELAPLHGRGHRLARPPVWRSAAPAGWARRSRSPPHRRGTSAAAVTTTYQWLRNGVAIGGETGTTYTLTAADLAKNITVKATGTRPGYITGTSTSNTIVGISGNAPVAVTEVSISGTGKVGTSLTATPPVWDNDPITTTYQWQRDGLNIGGATTTTYAVTASDVGKALTVRATGTRAGYDPGASVSNPITGVLGDAPNATTDVSISGINNKVGTTLTLTAPTWNTTGVATTYQWFRDATAITGATGGTYKLLDADVGHSVTVRATGTKSRLRVGHLHEQRHRRCGPRPGRQHRGTGDHRYGGGPRDTPGLHRHLGTDQWRDLHLPVARRRCGGGQGDQEHLRGQDPRRRAPCERSGHRHGLGLGGWVFDELRHAGREARIDDHRDRGEQEDHAEGPRRAHRQGRDVRVRRPAGEDPGQGRLEGDRHRCADHRLERHRDDPARRSSSSASTS